MRSIYSFCDIGLEKKIVKRRDILRTSSGFLEPCNDSVTSAVESVLALSGRRSNDRGCVYSSDPIYQTKQQTPIKRNSLQIGLWIKFGLELFRPKIRPHKQPVLFFVLVILQMVIIPYFLYSKWASIWNFTNNKFMFTIIKRHQCSGLYL